MIPIDRMPLSRCALGLVVSLVCVVPGGAARSGHDRGPDPEECCDTTGTFVVRFTVKIDPANHHAVIQLTDGRIVIVRLSDGTFEVRGNRSTIIRATTGSSSANCGFPLANGSGTVAGFPNVTGRYKDIEVTNDDIGGLLELGIGGELPTGQAICYEFTGARDPSVPDTGAALVDLAVKFTLPLVRSSPARPLPGYFFGFARGNRLVLGSGKFLYKGDGTGGLVPGGELPIATGQEPVVSVALNRLAGQDDVNDFAVASQDSSSLAADLYVFAQLLTGGFDRTQSLSLAQNYAAGNVFLAAGDLTGDGASEIVIASGSGRVDLFRNNGGTFSHSQTLELGSPIVGVLPLTLDFSSDGASDVIVVTTGAPQTNLIVNTLLGDGAGSLTPGPSTPLPVCVEDPSDPIAINAGLLNGDVAMDIIVATLGDACSTPNPAPLAISLLNRTDQPGAFAPQAPFVIPGSDTFQITPFTPPCAGTPALVANGGVFVGSGDGGFVDSSVRFALDGVAPAAVFPADVNLDGVVDLTAFFVQDDLLTIQTLSLGELATRPVKTSVSVVGKNLVVEGSGFTNGSQILVDGVAYKSKADRASPDTRLTSRKALKKIPPGTPVTVQVQARDGPVSEGVIFQR